MGYITNNLKVKIDFTLPEFSATKIVTWGFNVDDFNKGRYYIILSIYILTQFGLSLKFSKHVSDAGDVRLK